MNHYKRVVITGIGVVSPYGIGQTLFWNKLREGVSAAKWIDSFDASGMPTRFWANTPQTDAALVGFFREKESRQTIDPLR